MSRHHLAISRQRTQRSCDIFINQLVKKKKFPLLNEELDLWKMTFAEVFMNNRILVYNVN
jgi:hypothetical protein